MGLHRKPTRRDFLKTAGATIAVPYVITSTALGQGDRPPASDRIVMGGIGIGNMGRGDQGAFLGRPDVQYVAVCDVREGVRNDAKGKVDDRYKNSDCQAYNDFREMLARDDIDAVHVATPDHWHAIMVIEACRNGKDVYCQKPETRTLAEGPKMIAAARRYSRVVSGGSQRVLEDYREHGRSDLGRRAGYDQVDQRQRGTALPAVQSAGRGCSSRYGLGHVARPRTVGSLQWQALRW